MVRRGLWRVSRIGDKQDIRTTSFKSLVNLTETSVEDSIESAGDRYQS